MPDFATHHVFGENLEKSAAAEKYPAIYRWGLQGPDILFFRKIRVKISNYHILGNKMHEQHVAKLFSSMVAFCKESNGEVKEQVMAYLEGFAAHYALDSFLHPYIFHHQERLQKKKRGLLDGIAHCQIETDIDSDLYMYLNHNQVCTFWCDKKYSLAPSHEQTIGALYTFVLYDVYRELISPTEVIHALNNAKKIQKKLYCGHSSVISLGKFVDSAIGVPGTIMSHVKGNRPDWDSLNLGKEEWCNPYTGEKETTSIPQIMDNAAEYVMNLHTVLQRNCKGAILPLPLERDFLGKPLKLHK